MNKKMVTTSKDPSPKVFFWLLCVFIAACGLSLLVVSGGYSVVVMLRRLIEVAEHSFQACGLP